jgi:hypothetical protein
LIAEIIFAPCSTPASPAVFVGAFMNSSLPTARMADFRKCVDHAVPGNRGYLPLAQPAD